jgi:hypothetical protein
VNEDCFGRCGDIDHIPDSFCAASLVGACCCIIFGFEPFDY